MRRADNDEECKDLIAVEEVAGDDGTELLVGTQSPTMKPSNNNPNSSAVIVSFTIGHTLMGLMIAMMFY